MESRSSNRLRLDVLTREDMYYKMCKVEAKIEKRTCPVCGSDHKRLIYHQPFENIQNVTFIKSYDVVICNTCGAAYADQILKPKEMNLYYSEQSKYEPKKKVPLSECANVTFYEDCVSFLEKYIEKDSTILDCGAGEGLFLRILNLRGYENLQAIDPSQNCVDSLQGNYGITAQKSDIETYDTTEKYDVIILSAVLEHIFDVDTVIRKIKSLLKEKGILFIIVPNVRQFLQGHEAPFQQFSSEHVNYFTISSLKNLFHKYRFFVENYSESLEWINAGASSEPILRVVLRRGADHDIAVQYRKDIEIEAILEQYVDQSQGFLDRINHKFEHLARTQEPIMIWGVGTFTMKALALTELKNCNIVAFIDSNPKYVGGKWKDVNIVSPEALKNYTGKVLIGSIGFKKEIEQQICDKMKLKNEIISLDE